MLIVVNSGDEAFEPLTWFLTFVMPASDGWESLAFKVHFLFNNQTGFPNAAEDSRTKRTLVSVSEQCKRVSLDNLSLLNLQYGDYSAESPAFLSYANHDSDFHAFLCTKFLHDLVVQNTVARRAHTVLFRP